MLSDWWKSAFKMVLEDPQKILLKGTKNMKCPASLGISKAFTINPTNFVRPTFTQFFLNFNFYFN